MGINTSPDVMSKDPAEERIYDMEFQEKLSGTETIASIDSSSVSPAGGLSIDSLAISGTRVQVRVSGGVAGTNYTVGIWAISSLGQKLEGEGVIEVRD